MNLRSIYTADEIALHGEAKLKRQWHMTELLQLIGEAEEDLDWNRAAMLEKYYQKLANERNRDEQV